MAVQSETVMVTPGEWVSLCELRPTRKALRIQPQQGVLICSTQQPAVTSGSAAGDVPSGIGISTDTPYYEPELALSYERDGDLVTQEWYGWAAQPMAIAEGVVAKGALQESAVLVTQENIGGSSRQQFDLPPGVLVLVVMAQQFANNLAVNVQSRLQGQLTALVSQASFDATDTLSVLVAVYSWTHPGGVDLVWGETSACANIGPTLNMTLYQIGGNAGVDKTAAATATSATASVSTGALSSSNEVVIAVVGANSPDGVTWSVESGWIAGDQIVVFGSGPSGQATTQAQSAYKTVASSASVTYSVAIAGTSPTWVAVIASFFISSTAGQSIPVFVTEAFDVDDQPAPENTFAVSLPPLSDDAIDALNFLLDGLPNASTNPPESGQLDLADDGD